MEGTLTSVDRNVAGELVSIIKKNPVRSFLLLKTYYAREYWPTISSEKEATTDVYPLLRFFRNCIFKVLNSDNLCNFGPENLVCDICYKNVKFIESQIMNINKLPALDSFFC